MKMKKIDAVLRKTKRLVRKHQVIHEYKKASKAGKLVYLRPTDKQFGMTTRIIMDALKNDDSSTVILAPFESHRAFIQKEIIRYCETNGKQPPDRHALRRMVITPWNFGLEAMKIKNIFVDNLCSQETIRAIHERIRDERVVYRGFVTPYYRRRDSYEGMDER